MFVVALCLAVPALSDDTGQPDFETYLAGVKQRAVEEGISEATVDLAFTNLKPDPRVIGFDRKQPEFTQTFDEYLKARVSDYRVRRGRELMIEHAALLEKLERAYGVESHYIVAIWGLETGFGSYQGKYPIIRSLATLGHDPRRSTFFTDQLIMALRILDEEHITPDLFVGAWAGAMGQSQFMPGSFLKFAEDFDGDGRKDIWSSTADALASIANYLREAGWQPGEVWGGQGIMKSGMTLVPTASPASGCRALKHLTDRQTIQMWESQGVQFRGDLPDGDYAVVMPEAGSDGIYLAGENFRVILSYNCANKYAVSVGLLADALVSRPPS